MKNKNKLFYALIFSLLLNIIFLVGYSSGNAGKSLTASLSGMFEFSPPEPTPLKDFKKSIYPCRLTDGVYVPYSTFEQQGGFITKAEIDASFAEDTKANGISYYYAQDNSMFGGRLFVVFKANQKIPDHSGWKIIDLNTTTYHNTDMTCPDYCPMAQ